MKQREIRQNVIAAIYSVLIYKQQKLDYDPQMIIAEIFECSYEDVPLFARDLFVKTLLHQEEAILKIEPFLRKWTFQRLNLTMQALLLVSYTERNVIKETDKKVVINEAVDYAKQFADSTDYRYINAVLDQVLI